MRPARDDNRRRWIAAATVAVAALLFVAGTSPASAATYHVAPFGEIGMPPPYFYDMDVSDDAGRATSMTVRSDGTSAVVTARGQAFIPFTTDPYFLAETLLHCTPGIDRVKCTAAPGHLSFVSVYLGDNGDHGSVLGDRRASLFGGPGRDTLVGGGGDDFIDGGAGPDEIRGGAGSDNAHYGVRLHPVDVTLDGHANDGIEGEGDNVHLDVEDVRGTGYGDRLVGSAADNGLSGFLGDDQLDGGDGDDRLDGHAGADRIAGGRGEDLLLGGSEDDIIEAGDGEHDVIECGAGFDRVSADEQDEFRQIAECEQIEIV